MSIYFFLGYAFGHGVYFARDASYAASYARPSGMGFWQWTLFGQYYACNSTMIVPPLEINIGAIFVSFQISKNYFINCTKSYCFVYLFLLRNVWWWSSLHLPCPGPGWEILSRRLYYGSSSAEKSFRK